MPILHNERPLFRIKFKDANIREVRKGNELEWGLYEITYINKVLGGDADNIAEYVWGYPGYINEDFTLNLPEGDDYEYGGYLGSTVSSVLGSSNAYRTCAAGWYSDPECLTYIPAITRDFHKDLLLFCKWKQRKFHYSGTITNDRYEWISGGGGSGSFSPRNSHPTKNDGAYPWGGSAALAMPNCTWYVYYRAKEAGASAPTGNGYGNACNWINDSSLGEGWEARPGETNYQAGDIICYAERTAGDGGHVAFVESTDPFTLSASWYREVSSSIREQKTAAALYDYIWSGGGSTYQNAFWHTSNSVSGEYSGRVQGVLRYNNWAGGGQGGHWGENHPQSYDLSDTECSHHDGNYWDSGTQDYPIAPAKYDQDAENEDNLHPSPGVHWRTNQQWNPLVASTYERDITYELDSEGFKVKYSNWRGPYSKSVTGGAYIGWDTAIQGPIEGWYMNWDEDVNGE